ncbi:MAG: pilus assembly protein N-terminal domain-containing protein [Bdellovibrionales bacterium]|nr:pilus assembly protein N-terminal domain-containing protein [Bdellovibrionales bacterium]
MKHAKTAVLLLLFPWHAAAISQERSLAVGEQATLSISSGARFSVGNPEVIRVKAAPGDSGGHWLLVTGRRAGFSDLLVMEAGAAPRREVFRVRGKREERAPLAPDLAGALRGAPGVAVHSGGDGVVIQGQVQKGEHLALVDGLRDLARGRMRGSVELNALERMRLEEKIRRRLQSAGITGVRVRGAGSRVVLEGAARTQEQKELSEVLAREVFPGAVSHVRLPFSASEVLRFRVRLLEMERSDRQQLGFRWTDTLPGVLQVQKNLLKAGFRLDAALLALAQKGRARILSQPEIALNSDGVAELKVGGELPIRLREKNFASVSWKPWGMGLRLEVPGVSHERVRTKIQVDMTSLDTANAVDGVPALKTNQLHTVVDMELGKTLFLSGLLQAQEGESASGVPGLMDIPVLGGLFKSRDFLERRTELVVALTAEPVEGGRD